MCKNPGKSGVRPWTFAAAPADADFIEDGEGAEVVSLLIPLLLCMYGRYQRVEYSVFGFGLCASLRGILSPSLFPALKVSVSCSFPPHIFPFPFSPFRCFVRVTGAQIVSNE